jgi:hypothetical protein
MLITYQRPDINSFKDLANNPNYLATIVKGYCMLSLSEIDILVLNISIDTKNCRVNFNIVFIFADGPINFGSVNRFHSIYARKDALLLRKTTK